MKFLNDKIRKMDWIDIAFIKWACIAFGVLLVMFFPGLMRTDSNMLLILIVVLVIRPLYRVYIKK